MAEVKILKGLPASGKTTWALKFCAENPNYIRVSRDALRRMRGTYWLPEQEQFITKIEKFTARQALADGYNLVIDAMHLDKKYIDAWAKFFDEEGFAVSIEVIPFNTPYQECLRRDCSRDEFVGEEVIIQQYQKHLKGKQPMQGYNIEVLPFKVEKIIQDPKLPPAIIVDIDGTVSECTSRGHFDYDKVDTDYPIENVCNIVRTYLNYVQVIYLSGREDRCKDMTQKWLLRHGLWTTTLEPQLHMRKTGDFRKDCRIKKEIFDEVILGKYHVEFCLDDRNQVVKLWRDMGLTCLQVAYGDF